jgi:acyl-CoA thioester hydrolase
MAEPHVHAIQIYYEDTDFSGVVYHANYLKYFERAREHLLGTDRLVDIWQDEGLGFVVYKAELTYREGAVFGDTVEIHTIGRLESAYRAVFDQTAIRQSDGTVLCEGLIHLVVVDQHRKLAKLPAIVIEGMKARFPAD